MIKKAERETISETTPETTSLADFGKFSDQELEEELYRLESEVENGRFAKLLRDACLAEFKNRRSQRLTDPIRSRRIASQVMRLLRAEIQPPDKDDGVLHVLSALALCTSVVLRISSDVFRNKEFFTLQLNNRIGDMEEDDEELPS